MGTRDGNCRRRLDEEAHRRKDSLWFTRTLRLEVIAISQDRVNGFGEVLTLASLFAARAFATLAFARAIVVLRKVVFLATMTVSRN